MSSFHWMGGPGHEPWDDDDVYAADALFDPEDDDEIEYDELEPIEWPVPDHDFGGD